MKKLSLAILLSASLLPAYQSRAADPAPDQTTASQHRSFKNIGPAEFDALRQKGANVVLDVRTQKEYDAGHIPGAVHIDFYSSDFKKQIAKLDKSKTYLVHCASGGRSAKACSQMEKLNFTNLYNLKGGMRAWEKAGKPVEK
jgi:rhodanese-related sulfurtransferase